MLVVLILWLVAQIIIANLVLLVLLLTPTSIEQDVEASSNPQLFYSALHRSTSCILTLAIFDGLKQPEISNISFTSSNDKFYNLEAILRIQLLKTNH